MTLLQMGVTLKLAASLRFSAALMPTTQAAHRLQGPFLQALSLHQLAVFQRR